MAIAHFFIRRHDKNGLHRFGCVAMETLTHTNVSNVVRVAFSVCRAADHFTVAVGRVKALGKLKSQKAVEVNLDMLGGPDSARDFLAHIGVLRKLTAKSGDNRRVHAESTQKAFDGALKNLKQESVKEFMAGTLKKFVP